MVVLYVKNFTHQLQLVVHCSLNVEAKKLYFIIPPIEIMLFFFFFLFFLFPLHSLSLCFTQALSSSHPSPLFSSLFFYLPCPISDPSFFFNSLLTQALSLYRRPISAFVFVFWRGFRHLFLCFGVGFGLGFRLYLCFGLGFRLCLCFGLGFGLLNF